MRIHLLACVSLIVLGAVACDKDDPKGSASTASASAPAAPVAPPPAASAAPAGPSAAASAPLPAPRCPPGFTGNPMPAYCIKLPASYKVKDARTTPAKGSIAYDTGSATDNLMVSYDDTPPAQVAKDAEGELKFGGDRLEKKGDLPGGNKWLQGSHGDYERIVTVVKGPAPLTFKCSFAYKPAAAPPKDAIDACKSIVMPQSL